jgi:hypothetical protein
MSEYLDRLQNAVDSGTTDDFFNQTKPKPQEYKESPVTTPAFPDGFAAVEAEEASPILGNVVGISAEIGTGLYLTKKMHRSQQFLKWARGAKAVSAAAIVTPEPASTVAGIATFALTEAAIWGASNLIGQNIRKAYGVQDNISAGEVLASSVFGVGLVSKGGQKLISLGDGLAQMKAWGKGNELFVKGTKSFVSGATLGIAETALRQEAQLLLNERENRDAVEYLIGGAAGGGFNTLFDVFSRTGKWGQAKAKKITDNAKASLEAKALELDARLETTTPRARPKLRAEANKIRRSIEAVDDLGQQLAEASEALNNPKPKTEQPKEVDPLAPKEKVPETPLEEVVEKAPAEKPKETTETSTTKETNEESTLTPRQQEIESLSSRLVEMDSDTMTREMPQIEREAKRMYTNIYDEINATIHKLEDNNDPEAMQSLLENVRDLRNLNVDVKDIVETTGGRTLQAARKDAAKYKWTDMYSLRSQREDANLALLEDSLEKGVNSNKIEEEGVEELRTLLGLSQEKEKFVDTKPAKKGDKKDLTPEEQATKAQKQLQTKKEKLQEELDAKQKEFTGQKDLEDPKGEPKAQDPEIKDLKERIKWYNDAEAEVKTVETLEKRLAELAGIEGAGDMSTLRKTTQQNLKPPSKASPKVQELNTKITESKARMKQKLKEIDAAYDEINNPKEKKSQEQLDGEAETRSIDSLEKKLDELRAIRSGTLDKPDAKNVREKSAQERDLEDRIKFYRNEEKQIVELEKQKTELARLAAIEGEGNITQLKQETKGKPDLPTQPDQVADVKKQIAASKARMRKKLSDIDKAQKKMEKEDHQRFRATLMKDIEEAIFASLDVDRTSTLTKGLRWVAQSRQLALINQLPSAFAGLATGSIALARETNRALGNYTARSLAGKPMAGKLAKVDLEQSMKNWSYMFSKENMRAVKRTIAENESATDSFKDSKVEEANFRPNVPRGTAGLVAGARRRAEKTLAAQRSLIKRADNNEGETLLQSLNRWYFFGQSGGVRLIQGGDELFKRPLIMGRVNASAKKEAILELESIKQEHGVNYTDKDVDELANTKYENSVTEADGLTVLRASHEHLEEVDLGRQELLFAANSDNIEEVIAPYSEKVVRGLKDIAGDDHVISFALNAIMPYVGVGTRGVYKGLAWTTAPIRTGVGHVVSKDTLGNPYIKKIAEAKDTLDELQSKLKERQDTEFDPKGKESIEAFEEEIANNLALINRHDERRIQYNADAIADTLMTVELGGAMFLAAGAGVGTGSMTFLEEDQKKKLQLGGKTPFKFLGMDYKAIGHAAFPLVVMGDQKMYAQIRKMEAQSGTKILDEDLTWYDVMKKSLLSLATEQPLSTGIKNVSEILGENPEVATSSMLASYTLMPAQAKKLIQDAQKEGRMVDLKGASFWERVGYQALAIGIPNYKTDYFGYDLEEPASFAQRQIIRQWPDTHRSRTRFEEVLGADLVGTIQDKPEYIQVGLRMKDFVNESGTSLTYQYAQTLKETTIGGKTMIDAVDELIMNPKWAASLATDSEVEGEKWVSPPLLELNSLMREYYDEAREALKSDNILTTRYINEDNETLFDALERFQDPSALFKPTPVNLFDIID